LLPPLNNVGISATKYSGIPEYKLKYKRLTKRKGGGGRERENEGDIALYVENTYFGQPQTVSMNFHKRALNNRNTSFEIVSYILYNIVAN